jgi:hypothetical protein
MFYCKKCFFQYLKEEICAKGLTPKEGERCSSFTSHVGIDFSNKGGVSDKVE